jgi:hypothetical protein
VTIGTTIRCYVIEPLFDPVPIKQSIESVPPATARSAFEVPEFDSPFVPLIPSLFVSFDLRHEGLRFSA